MDYQTNISIRSPQLLAYKRVMLSLNPAFLNGLTKDQTKTWQQAKKLFE
jgi:hypothetical protein